MTQYTQFKGGTFDKQAALTDALRGPGPRLYAPNPFYKNVQGTYTPPAAAAAAAAPAADPFGLAHEPGELTFPGAGAAYQAPGAGGDSNRVRYTNMQNPATGGTLARPVYDYYDPYTGRYLPRERDG